MKGIQFELGETKVLITYRYALLLQAAPTQVGPYVLVN